MEKPRDALTYFEQNDVLKEVRFISNFGFLLDVITASQSKNYSLGKAVKTLHTNQSKLSDMEKTENQFAETAPVKFLALLQKNEGLTLASQKMRRISISEPKEIKIYAFAPVTSVDDERVFSVSKSFLECPTRG